MRKEQYKRKEKKTNKNKHRTKKKKQKTEQKRTKKNRAKKNETIESEQNKMIQNGSKTKWNCTDYASLPYCANKESRGTWTAKVATRTSTGQGPSQCKGRCRDT